MPHVLRRSWAAFAAALLLISVVERGHAQAPPCPCSLFSPSAVPTNPAVTDGVPIETGVKFRADVDGYVTAIRFYKGTLNTGAHVAHVWSAAGALLAEAAFVSETASGWQEVSLASPLPVAANTTYVASYHADSGYFAYDAGFFGASGVDAPPLHAPQSGGEGPNGVFLYGASGFPANGAAANYWVDVVFQTSIGPDTTPPTVTSLSPAAGATGAGLTVQPRATFSEGLDPSTVNASTVHMRDAADVDVAGTVSYQAATRSIVFSTTAGLLPQTAYAVTITGGAAGVKDPAGNALAGDVVWTFTTAAATPPPDEGPGGPILVVSSTSNPFGRYYAEILRTEGLNAFTATDISLVTAGMLAGYDVVILAELPLSAAQAGMFADYVSSGGSLVAMRPDKQLAGLLGLSDAGAALANAYLQIDTTGAPGAGITGESMQFHGTADRYTAAGASVVATLSSDAVTATANPAVTIRSVGTLGGYAAAFTFDLARSIVYTRQGNPAWSGLERDGIAPRRSDDLFFGAAPGDPQPDWIDLTKVAIPQADEQQRLLANLVLHLDRAKKPLPRFWYLPRGLKAALVMTGDDHGNGGTVGRFNQYKALSPAGCSVADWECVRSTSYVYNGTPGMDDAASAAFVADGFEVGLHVSTNCADWTPASLATFYGQQIAQFTADHPSVPALRTNRTHCIVWSDYVTQPKVELANGIRFDTNYYYFPPGWVQDRPGFFTGSGMPMRFADVDGSTIDVYQATTQMTDESGQSYPFTADTLFDRALGPLGYYGVFTANMHTDAPTEQPSDASVASALARGVPVVSAKQMLDWLDGRNGSSFGSIAWTGGTLSFTIAADATANGLTAMVPTVGRGGALTGITRNGAAVAYTVQTIKGVEYAFFAALDGSYAASYVIDTTPPVISGVTATPGQGNTAAIAWSTDEPADSRVDYGTSAASLTLSVSSSTLTASHALTLTGLAPLTTYFYRVTSADAASNVSSSAIESFTTPATVFSATDTTAVDFGAGTGDGQIYVAQTADGEVLLAPASGSELSGTALPADWTSSPWNAGGTAVVAAGSLVVDGAKAGTSAAFTSGRALEFVAVFGGAPFQHGGFGDTYDAAPWAMFSTFAGGGLYARTHSGAASADTPIAGALLGSAHLFRIEWTPASVIFSIDGAVVATHAIAVTQPMRPLFSDFSAGGGGVTVDWVRLSPYAAAGTFTSRVFDAGQPVNWGSLSWTSSTPPGTAVALAVRTGGTPVPDGSWTAFSPVASPGGAIAGSSRYLQYQAALTSNDPSVTPALESVTIGYTAVPPNHPPAAVDDAFAGTQDTALTVNAPGVLANDTDADGEALTAALATGPAHGSISLSSNGGFVYTPAAGFSGTDTFTYTAFDGHVSSAAATVTLTVAPVLHQPIAAADGYSLNEDATLNVLTPGVLANDSDPDGRPLTAVLVSGPSHGTLLTFKPDGAFKYKPAANYNGVDAFVYRARAGTSDFSANTTVTLTIGAVNDAPVAAWDIYRNDAGHVLSVAAPGVLANDTDVEGGPLTAVLVTSPDHGALTLLANGSFTYTPNATFHGSDRFVYKANDGGKKSAATTVYITGLSPLDEFDAIPDDYETAAGVALAVGAPGVLANDHNPDGGPLTTELMTSTAHGTLVLNEDGSFVYTPDAGFTGTDSFVYRVRDEDGTLTYPTIVTITVHP